VIILIGTVLFFVKHSPKTTAPVTVLTELPWTIERNNPVPGILHWDQDDYSYYYFNWGYKPSTGFSIQYTGLTGKTIYIKAVVPDQNTINAQVLTYPYLFLKLPKGKYSYKVADHNGHPLQGIFQPKTAPLRLIVMSPVQDGLKPRIVYRDPHFNNQQKSPVQLALAALFNQDELLEFNEADIVVEKASFSNRTGQWSVVLSRGFKALSAGEQQELVDTITATVQANEDSHPHPVVVTVDTHPY
jgi:hypothetical protein